MTKFAHLSVASSLAAGAFWLALTAAPAVVEAACCQAYDYGDAAGNKDQVISHFSSRIGRMEERLAQVISLATGQLSGNLKEQIQASGQIAQAQDDREVMRRIEDARMKAILEAQTGASACSVITGNEANGPVDDIIRAVVAQNADELDAWDLGSKDARGASQGSSRGSSRGAQEARLAANAQFCNSEMEAIGLCTVEKNSHLQGASLNLSKSIFAARTYDDETYDAAETFVLNAINPEPQGRFEAHLANTDQGLRMLTRRQANRARLSVAENFIAERIANRAPTAKLVANSGRHQLMRTWAEGMATNVLGYSTNGDNFPNGVSWTDWMELRSKAWFHNSRWLEQVSNADASTNTKEIATILAFMTYQNWETYKLLERMGTMQATQLAIMTEQSR